MDKMARNDLKRNSVPIDLTSDLALNRAAVSETFDQAMEAFYKDNKTTLAKGKGNNRTLNGKSSTKTDGYRKRSISDKMELSTDLCAPGVLKIFGESIIPGVQYKSVLASCRSTSQELVKQALERYGLSPAEYENFVLCDVVGRADTDILADDNARLEKWKRIYARILSDRDKPLLLQTFWKPIDGYCRRYELHERKHVTDFIHDDISGLNKNARSIMMSKLRPSTMPLPNSFTLGRSFKGLNVNIMDSESTTESVNSKENSYKCNGKITKISNATSDMAYPTKHPFFVNIRGFDVHRDKTLYVIQSNRFQFGNPNLRNDKPNDDIPKIHLFGPDIESTHCNFNVFRFMKSDVENDTQIDRSNFFLELEPVVDNVCVNGHKVNGATIMKSGDILSVGRYYVFLYKDCSKGNDIPLVLPWFPVTETSLRSDSKIESCELKLKVRNGKEESNSNTDESVDASIAERMAFAYEKEKEEELVKYTCAMIQQQNTTQTYSLTVAYVFSMCIEHASRKFEQRQLRHLFLRILFSIRENVAETAKFLSASKFSCTLLDTSRQQPDQIFERLLLWISNCVQLLLFLKHAFHQPEVDSSERISEQERDCTISRMDDSAKHALGQLVTGLEEIIMFCFQQCVYTITKTIHDILPAFLNSNPFSDANSDQHSMEDIIRMFELLAEITHSVMLHEGITRQLFTYLFFFTSTNTFNKLVIEDSGKQYYNWQSGVRLRANISLLEDWATKNGLEDEFSQMFESLLAVSELLATSKSTLLKCQWKSMKTNYHPLTSKQLYHVLSNYQLMDKPMQTIWLPTPHEMEQILREDMCYIPLSTHPPFALPDNYGVIDLARVPEDTSFWNHLRRLKSLYGITEEDSDSGLSISNTPCGSVHGLATDTQGKSFFEQAQTDVKEIVSPWPKSQNESVAKAVMCSNKSRIPVKKSHTNPWSLITPKPGSSFCKSENDRIDNDGGNTNTRAADRMKNERSGFFKISDSTQEQNNKIFSTLPSKAFKSKLCSNSNQLNSENKDQEILNKYNQEVSNLVRRSNVDNCSARTLPRPLEPRQRSKSIGVPRAQDQTKVVEDSCCVEDFPMRHIRRKPSASFQEAIRNGYNSDTTGYHQNRINEVETKLSDSVAEATLGCHIPKSVVEDDMKCGTPKISSEADNKYHIQKNSTVGINGMEKRRKSHVADSSSSDEVYVNEQGVDDLYNIYQCDITTDRLTNNLTSFKPITTLNYKNNFELRTHTKKLTTVNFDSKSRSPFFELTKDDLLLNGADDIVSDENHDSSDLSIDGDQEVLPGELFTEINESTLAALKRHGSSLNVAPSCDSSPEMHAKIYNAADTEERKHISPSPLMTVYLEKGNGSLGIGLIDGLHTTLRISGIYIRKILPNSPADVNGCLQAGDRIVAVNGNSVIGADYDSTMKAIKEAGNTLTLLVAKGSDSVARTLSVTQL